MFLLLVSSGLFAQNKVNSPVVSGWNTLFDNSWLFTKDNVSGAEQVNYNDGSWRKVDLPHDWSI